jgi:hypothetical protein
MQMPSLSTYLGFTAQLAAGAIGIGTGRLVPTAAALAGLISVVSGGLPLARSAGRIGIGNGRAGAILALVTGLISVVVGGLHAANSAGGFGTGNGLAGAVAALVLGLIGMSLGALALARSRRSRSTSLTRRWRRVRLVYKPPSPVIEMA